MCLSLMYNRTYKTTVITFVVLNSLVMSEVEPHVFETQKN